MGRRMTLASRFAFISATVAAGVLVVLVPVSGTAAPTLESGAKAHVPFNLGSSPVPAVGRFTNGRGGCPVQTSFTDRFQFLATGDGMLTITQPSTGDRVSGPIKPNGSFQLRSAGESYDGKITGKAATASYAYTAGGCTETYDAEFDLDRDESDLAFGLAVAGKAKIKGASAKVVYRIVVVNNGPDTSPSAPVQLRLSRAAFGTSYQWGVKVGVLQKKRIGCTKRDPKQATTVWTCLTPVLNSGEAAGVAVVVQARKTGNYVAQGVVEGVNFDPVPGNNGAMRRTSVSR